MEESFDTVIELAGGGTPMGSLFLKRK